MRHIMICFSGFSGTGKDECAGHLKRRYGAIHTGLADPAKRHMADLYGFNRDQLFGPSSMRNAGDLRFPKNDFFDMRVQLFGTGEKVLNDFFRKLGSPTAEKVLDPNKRYFYLERRELSDVESVPGCGDIVSVPGRLGSSVYFVEEGHPRFWLSPREALQKYCNLMNDLHLDTWVRKGVEIQRKLAEVLTYVADKDLLDRRAVMRYDNDRMTGLNERPNERPAEKYLFTCFSDFRHRHEIAHVRQCTGLVPAVVRVKNPKVPSPPYQHRSELEQADIPDSAFDFIINNDGTLEDLYGKVDGMVDEIISEKWAPLGPWARLT